MRQMARGRIQARMAAREITVARERTRVACRVEDADSQPRVEAEVSVERIA